MSSAVETTDLQSLDPCHSCKRFTADLKTLHWPLPLTIVVLICAAFVAWVAYSMIATIWRGIASRSWHRTEGRVKSFGVNKGIPFIVFEYQVEGEIFESNKLIPSSRSAQYGKWYGREAVRKSVYLWPDGTLKFRPATTVEVCYDPANPRDAALVPGLRNMGDGGFWTVVRLIACVVLGVYTRPIFSKYITVVLPAMFLTAGLSTLWSGFRNLRRWSRSASFPSVPGRLLHADVTRGEGGYSPKVELEYEVEGEIYKSWEWNALPVERLKSRSRAAAELLVGELRANPTVPVYFDPKAPWDAFLRRNPKSDVRAPFIIGGVFVVLAAVMIFFNAVPLMHEPMKSTFPPSRPIHGFHPQAREAKAGRLERTP